MATISINIHNARTVESSQNLLTRRGGSGVRFIDVTQEKEKLLTINSTGGLEHQEKC